MKAVVLIGVAGLLAGCGVDGEPVRPSLDTNIGVGADGDVRTRTDLGVRMGNVGVHVGV